MKQLITLSFLVFVFPLIISASEISFQSGSMGAIVTLKPDEIVAGEPSSLQIRFSDSRNIFTLKRCDCRIKITHESGKVLIDYKIEQDDRFIEEHPKDISLVFPKTGKYAIAVSGTSLNQVFSPFELKGETSITSSRVSQGEKNWQNFKQRMISYVIPLMILLIVTGFGFQFILKKK